MTVAESGSQFRRGGGGLRKEGGGSKSSTSVGARIRAWITRLWGSRAGMARLHVSGMQFSIRIFIRRVTARYRSKGHCPI